MLPCGVVRSALAELGERGPDPNQLGGMLRSPSLELSKEVSAFLWDVETEREVVGAIQPARAANSEISRRASETDTGLRAPRGDAVRPTSLKVKANVRAKVRAKARVPMRVKLRAQVRVNVRVQVEINARVRASVNVSSAFTMWYESEKKESFVVSSPM